MRKELCPTHKDLGLLAAAKLCAMYSVRQQGHTSQPHSYEMSLVVEVLVIPYMQVSSQQLALERMSDSVASKQAELAGLMDALTRRRAELAHTTEELGEARASVVSKVRVFKERVFGLFAHLEQLLVWWLALGFAHSLWSASVYTLVLGVWVSDSASAIAMGKPPARAACASWPLVGGAHVGSQATSV